METDDAVIEVVSVDGDVCMSVSEGAGAAVTVNLTPQQARLLAAELRDAASGQSVDEDGDEDDGDVE